MKLSEFYGREMPGCPSAEDLGIKLPPRTLSTGSVLRAWCYLIDTAKVVDGRVVSKASKAALAKASFCSRNLVYKALEFWEELGFVSCRVTGIEVLYPRNSCSEMNTQVLSPRNTCSQDNTFAILRKSNDSMRARSHSGFVSKNASTEAQNAGPLFAQSPKPNTGKSVASEATVIAECPTCKTEQRLGEKRPSLLGCSEDSRKSNDSMRARARHHPVSTEEDNLALPRFSEALKPGSPFRKQRSFSNSSFAAPPFTPSTTEKRRKVVEVSSEKPSRNHAPPKARREIRPLPTNPSGVDGWLDDASSQERSSFLRKAALYTIALAEDEGRYIRAHGAWVRKVLQDFEREGGRLDAEAAYRQGLELERRRKEERCKEQRRRKAEERFPVLKLPHFPDEPHALDHPDTPWSSWIAKRLEPKVAPVVLEVFQNHFKDWLDGNHAKRFRNRMGQNPPLWKCHRQRRAQFNYMYQSVVEGNRLAQRQSLAGV